MELDKEWLLQRIGGIEESIKILEQEIQKTEKKEIKRKVIDQLDFRTTTK